MAQVKPHLESIHPALGIVWKQEQHNTTAEMWITEQLIGENQTLKTFCSGVD